jgi:hypothetical protein
MQPESKKKVWAVDADVEKKLTNESAEWQYYGLQMSSNKTQWYYQGAVIGL